ncbi:MAG TPA: hypothetical protein VLX91_03400 [Candidatus Acidoferrales bacterium]|nr:hypothetical protein [Candidatus Acidoferrales bacterium]
MKHIPQKYFVISIAPLLFLFGFGRSASFAQGNGGWQHLNYAIFFTSRDVDSLLVDSVQFHKTMNYFGPVKPRRVYLDGEGRDGGVNVPLLQRIAARFRAMGIDPEGAMVPTSRFGPSVYNNPEDLESLKERMQGLAKVFDEIILDDWLFTVATDSASVADRGSMSWPEYRTKLLLEQTKKYIIDPAKEVNPKVNIIIKYPNWYEGFGENGYDIYNETRQFDKMAVGIETRVPEAQHQHIPIYSGYVLQKWESSVDPSKWVGSWLDNYGMKGAYDDYNAQVWQAIMAQSPEIILWCAGQLWPTNPSSDVYPHFTKELPEFNRVAGMLQGMPRGVPIYLPYGSAGEYNIFGYLGMAGIPLKPVAEFPKESQSAIFCLNSLKDTSLADEMLGRLREGKDVFMTYSLWRRLRRTEFKNTLSLLDYNGIATSDKFGLLDYGYRERTVTADRQFTFPGVEATTWPESRDVTLSSRDYDFSVLMRVPYLKGTLYVLNMPEDYYDLLELPTDVLNAIRRSFVMDLGVEFDGPGHIAMYPFGDKQYVLYNMSDTEAPVNLRFYKEVPGSGWKNLVSDESLEVKQDTSLVRFRGPVISEVSLELKPYGIAVVQAP